MATTATNIDKTARTAYEMAEAQRDSFEALAENFAAAQRRSMGLAEGGLEFVKLQEDNARRPRSSSPTASGSSSSSRRTPSSSSPGRETPSGCCASRPSKTSSTAEAFARAIGRQQESFRTLTQGWVGAYTDFFSPFAYARQGMRAFQRATQQSLEATQQVARQGLQATEQVTKQGSGSPRIPPSRPRRSCGGLRRPPGRRSLRPPSSVP